MNAILLSIMWVLSWFGTNGQPNANTDYIFTQYIERGCFPYETQIPWSAEYYMQFEDVTIRDIFPEEFEDKQEEATNIDYNSELESVPEVIQETPVTTPSGDLGTFSIPSAGINVGLYSDGNAFQSSGCASVQYYNQYGIKWIADHVNQDGFWNLKNVAIGDTVYVNDTAYTVVDNVYAADYYSNFNAWVSYIGDSTLVIQTCEGDGARLVRCQ